jgi:hypothetical protein
MRLQDRPDAGAPEKGSPVQSLEQWLMRHLVDPESLDSRLQGRVTPTAEDFEKNPD